MIGSHSFSCLGKINLILSNSIEFSFEFSFFKFAVDHCIVCYVSKLFQVLKYKTVWSVEVQAYDGDGNIPLASGPDCASHHSFVHFDVNISTESFKAKKQEDEQQELIILQSDIETSAGAQ